MIISVNHSVLYKHCYCSQNEFDFAVLTKTNEPSNEILTISCPVFKYSLERNFFPYKNFVRKTVMISSKV